jgi:hypothetical protein
MRPSTLEQLKRHLRPGRVYRREDLLPWSQSVDRHLKELTLDGTLQKLLTGLYCGPRKFGPHLNVSYRGEKGKTTGDYVPKAAEQATREGVAAWQQMQQCLRALAELNKERNLQCAREADSQ